MTTDTVADAGRGAAQECAAIAADLERLKLLISDAGDRLLASFNTVGDTVPRLSGMPDEQRRIDGAVSAAVTALQFQDMANQLTAHAQRRLDALQDLLRAASAELALVIPAVHPHPVGQAEMSAGSIDLFEIAGQTRASEE